MSQVYQVPDIICSLDLCSILYNHVHFSCVYCLYIQFNLFGKDLEECTNSVQIFRGSCCRHCLTVCTLVCIITCVYTNCMKATLAIVHIYCCTSIYVFQVSQKIAKLYSEMIFFRGYVHCDPHPGNVLVNKDDQGRVEVVLLDHGLYTVSVCVCVCVCVCACVHFCLCLF